MVHHDRENEIEPIDDALPPVQFHAHVEPPCGLAPPPKEPRPCCPKPAEVPPIPFVYHGDPLVEALPTILVGIGFAWVVGVAVGAFIFSAPME